MFNRISFTIRQLYESIAFGFESITVNKTRAFLSLLGITIGIFAIISVYTAIDTMESYLRNSLESISKSALQISQWPWGPEEGSNGEYQWWKYANRPKTTEHEFTQLVNMTPNVKYSAFAIYFNRPLKYGNDSYSPNSIVGATEQYRYVRTTDIAQGRFFSPFEFQRGTNSAIIGATIAQELFQGADPVGKTIKIGNQRAEVIGVFAKEGQSIIGASWDEQVYVPLNFAKNFSSVRNASPEMYVVGDETVSVDDFKEQVRANLRQIRRLSPVAESNFALNDVGTVTKQLDSIFSMINLAGGIIGLFSILVGGFGVANIMFVSVRERTSQIGIQKALGARPYTILTQFTFEAVLLSVVGGAVGLLLIWIMTVIVTLVLDFDVILSVKNIIIGLGISSVVGGISGIFPAYAAATMDPVKAISKS